MSRYKAALLDIDGTLVDSNDLHAQAWVVALGERGYDVDFAEIREAIGMGGDKILPKVAGLSDEQGVGAEIAERRKKIFRERFMHRVRAFPQVRQLLERMKDDGLRLVVATSASEEEVAPLLDAAGVRDLIDETTSSGDVDDSKPDPDVVLAALKRAGCGPDEAIMLGDTPYDIAAASAAGVTAVAVRCGGWDFPDGGGAAAVFDDPADLLRYYEASPFNRA